MSTDYERAAEKVDKKIGFYKHFISYVFVNLLLFIINFVCTPGNWWFYWVTIFWGIGVLFNFLKVFVIGEKFGDEYRDKKIQEELDKMNK